MKTFRERQLIKDSIPTSFKEQVTMFLNVVSHNQRFRVIHNISRRSNETISLYFKQVMYVNGELRGEIMKQFTGQTPPKV